MKTTLRMAIIGVSILLAGCASSTPPVARENGSSAGDAPTAMGRLASLSLPDGWKKIASNEGHIVTYMNDALKDDVGAPDGFIAQVMIDVCSEAFANEQSKLSWGDAVPPQYKAAVYAVNGVPVGYSWSAFDGIPGEDRVPGYIHWCIHQPQPGMDIDVSTQRTDKQMKDFIQKTFIPLWLKQFAQ